MRQLPQPPMQLIQHFHPRRRFMRARRPPGRPAVSGNISRPRSHPFAPWAAPLLIAVWIGAASVSGQYAPYTERLQREASERIQRQIDHYRSEAYRPNSSSATSYAPLQNWINQLRAQEEEARQRRRERAAQGYDPAVIAEWARQSREAAAAADREAQLRQWEDYKRRGRSGDANAAYAVARTLLRGDSRLPKDEVTGVAGALPWLRLAANAGNADAAWRLGRELERAAPEGQVPAETLAAYRRAVELGDHDAVPWAVNLAQSGGDGFKPDPAEAWRLAQVGVAAGHHGSMRTAAFLLLGKPKLSEAERRQVVEWLQAASATDTLAAAQMARMYFYGYGVKADETRGVELAKRVLPKAPTLFELVLIVAEARLQGIGGETKDIAGAIAMLERAAEEGMMGAARELAFWYGSGAFGVPQSLQDERRWGEQAARMGSVEAAARLARDYRRSTPPDLAKAVEFYELASRGGDKKCATELARLLSTGGPGLAARPGAARTQAKRAADLGFGPGQMLYAQFLLEGIGGDRDPVAAARWMREAATGHFPPAQNAYGLMLISGTGAPKDERGGVEWITQAAANEEPLAMLFMGESFLNGRYGLPPDAKLGRGYLTAAADCSDQEVAAAAKQSLDEANSPAKTLRLDNLRINQPASKSAETSIYDALRLDPVARPSK